MGQGLCSAPELILGLAVPDDHIVDKLNVKFYFNLEYDD